MHRNWVETLKEDRDAVILADTLGFYDAFMGEHLTDRCENITNSMVFNAMLIPATKQIKLATGTTNLSHIHPVVSPSGHGHVCLSEDPHFRQMWPRRDRRFSGARHPGTGS